MGEELCNESDVGEGQDFHTEVDGQPVIVLRKDGKVCAFYNVCKHQGGPTSLQGDELLCEWHGATYEPCTGKRTGPPAPEDSALDPLPIEVRNGKIYKA